MPSLKDFNSSITDAAAFDVTKLNDRNLQTEQDHFSHDNSTSVLLHATAPSVFCS